MRVTEKKTAKRPAPAKTMDAYIATQAPDVRAALTKLRKQIRAAAPKAVEGISWGMPSFKLEGPLVGFAAFKEHLSFFPMSVEVMDAFGKEIELFRASKGTLRFTVERPLPAALVKKIVKARIAENKAVRTAKAGKAC
ncbi:MAG: DUF1801 domain-containing protein [Spirochaetales bacterium]|nr:DUF1801 domain-containing protein [Spirochaetales bacterium]